jgi:hypothetical protein
MPWMNTWRLARRYTTIRALLFVLVFISPPFSDSANPVYQRCNVGVTDGDSDASHGWEAASCHVCEENNLPVVVGQEEDKASGEKKKDITLNILIQITIPKLEPELLNVAAGLLMHPENAVTIAYMSWFRGTSEDYDQVLRRRIRSKIPCSSHAGKYRLEERLKLHSIDIAPPIRVYCSKRVNLTLSYLEPVQSCIGVAAPAQYRLYSHLFRKLEEPNYKIPDVIVTDMYGYGALAVAEEFGIPSLVLMDQHSFYEATRQTGGRNLSIRHWLESYILGTIHAVMGIKTFSDINRFRGILGLKRLKHRIALWNSATAVAVLGHEFNASAPSPKASFPPILHLQGPIFPPCMPCRNRSIITQQKPAIQQGETVTVLFLPPWDLSASWSREVTKGLTMARRSLLCYQGACDRTATTNCWHDRLDLRVKWLVDTDLAHLSYKPTEPIPSFIQLENASLFLDDLISHSEEGLTIVLAHCDDEARAALLLGIAVVCLATRSKMQQSRPGAKVYHLPTYQAREIAMQVTQLVWNLKTKISPEEDFSHLKSKQSDSLHRLVRVIDGTGRYLARTPKWPLPNNFKAVSTEDLQFLLRAHFAGEEAFITGARNALSPGHLVLWWACYTFLAICTALSVTRFFLPSSRFELVSTIADSAFVLVPCQWLEALVGRSSEVLAAWDAVKSIWKGGEKAPVRQTASLINKRQRQQKTNNGGRVTGNDGLQTKRSDKQR